MAIRYSSTARKKYGKNESFQVVDSCKCIAWIKIYGRVYLLRKLICKSFGLSVQVYGQFTTSDGIRITRQVSDDPTFHDLVNRLWELDKYPVNPDSQRRYQ